MPSNPLNADTSVATTECPRLASTCAVAIPMPRAAPVIKTLSAFDIRKSLTCVAEHFDSFIHMTFPSSHADWASQSPQRVFGGRAGHARQLSRRDCNHSAQGCEERATLGHRETNFPTATRLRQT